jgi:hypothetical protein
LYFSYPSLDWLVREIVAWDQKLVQTLFHDLPASPLVLYKLCQFSSDIQHLSI